MSAYKRIPPSDQFQDIIVANKQWRGTYSSYPYSDDYITVYTGQNITGSFSILGPQSQSVYYKSEYDSINQLFYQEYPILLSTQSRVAYSLNYESASECRNTGSYFIYNVSPLYYEQFPTDANSTIKTIYIDKSVYGDSLLPGSSIISSSAFYIVDDGNGNLYDYKYVLAGMDLSYVDSGYIDYGYIIEYIASSGSAIQVGNAFYPFGLYVITNQDYQQYFPISGSMPVQFAFKNIYPIYENYVYCKIKAGEFNLTYNPSLLQSTASSQVQDFATGSIISHGFGPPGSTPATSSYFTPYITSVGLYNDTNELLMVAKLAIPTPISANTDLNIILRTDS